MTRSYAGDLDAGSETLWDRVLSNDVECFRWKGHGTGWEACRNKSKRHPALSYMWSWHSRLHMCFVTSHCLTWSKVFSFCHWSSQLVLCFWPLPRFKQETIFAAHQTWRIWAVLMVASTFIPGSESMRHPGLNQSCAKISKNEFCRLRSLWRGCFVQRFCGPKSLIIVCPQCLRWKRKSLCGHGCVSHPRLVTKSTFPSTWPKGMSHKFCDC